MKLLPECEALIKEWESCALTAYQDCSPKKNWTIGWGRTFGVKEGMTCTQEQADALFDKDIQVFAAEVLKALEITLNNFQYSALVCFCYNVGVEAFKTSHMLKLIHASQFQEAADEFPKWDHADGVEIAGLKNRRLAERELFLRTA